MGVGKRRQSGRPETRHYPTAAQVLGIGGEGILRQVKAIAAGVFHNLAVLEDGTAVAWGYNGGGQLGEGTRANFWEGNANVRHVPAPVRVVGADGQAALEIVAAVGAGYEISWARIDDGTLRSWGWNVFGELGAGLPLGVNRDRPQLIRRGEGGEGGDQPLLGDIVEFAGGVRHALARDAKGSGLRDATASANAHART